MNLSNSALTLCNLWRDIGCPRNGLVNAERLRCKYKYKQAIKDAAFNAEQSLNDELFLCTKDNLSFWKAKRFCANNVAPTTMSRMQLTKHIETHHRTDIHVNELLLSCHS